MMYLAAKHYNTSIRYLQDGFKDQKQDHGTVLAAIMTLMMAEVTSPFTIYFTS